MLLKRIKKKYNKIKMKLLILFLIMVLILLSGCIIESEFNSCYDKCIELKGELIKYNIGLNIYDYKLTNESTRLCYEECRNIN